MTQLPQYLVNGFALGSLYVLAALSITIIFGLSGIVNFSVGAFMTLAAYLTWAMVSSGVSFWISLVVVTVILGVLGVMVERVFFRWTLDNPLNGFIVSLGLILIVEAMVIEVWGTGFRNMRPPLSGVFEIGGASFDAVQLMVVGISLVAMALLLWWLRFSWDGLALRAAARDKETAYLMGVPATRLSVLAFAAAMALLGVAGALLSSLAVLQPFVGNLFLIKAFAIAIAGGIGNLKGAFVAGLLVALVEAIAVGYLPGQWTQFYVFGIIALILIFRPSGLFGARHG